ncbi:MAG TPA: glycosyltransferase family 4 protein, partial [Microthrixaceae bacterium]|nr:glycosyltransferase family 4 protein [Microthrixaceae bacterium]
NRTDIGGMLRHRSAFKKLSPDLLQFNLSSASSCQWPMLAATSVRGLRRVAIENSPMGVWSPTSAKLKRLTSRKLAEHIAVGDRTARLIEETSGLPPMSISTIYHGVPRPERVPTSRPDGPTLLTVARHDPVKGLDVLLDALALAPISLQHVLVGSGSETAALKDQCSALGLDDRVEFRDIPFDKPVAGMMSSFDGLVLPSRLEGFPVTIVEAMLAGLPVIATDVGSVDEAVIPGETGWIVPSADPQALADAIGELLADPDAAATMGAKGREIAEERFTLDATIAAYMDMYRRVLAR